MKYALPLIFIIFLSFLAIGQQAIQLDYCNCSLKIDQKVPALNGRFEKYCNGILVEKGIFLNDEKDGLWETFDKKGKLIRKISYSQGLFNGPVTLFFNNGIPKLTAAFVDGHKSGKWVYYNKKGKTLVEGLYDKGKPIGIWTVFDSKGKKPKIQYDYDKLSYVINEEITYHKDNEVMQNENTSEFYILRYPYRPDTKGTAPLGGFLLNSDFFVEIVEIPLDYWDTNIQYLYKADFKITSDNSTNVDLVAINNHMPNSTPIFPFLVVTNPPNKIKTVTYNELSKKLLEAKLKEALNFLLPWVFVDKSEVEVYVPYVINIPYVRN